MFTHEHTYGFHAQNIYFMYQTLNSYSSSKVSLRDIWCGYDIFLSHSWRTVKTLKILQTAFHYDTLSTSFRVTQMLKEGRDRVKDVPSFSRHLL